jgi:hypothetical protein
MSQSVLGGGAFDRAADERGGRAGVLMVGMPRATRERRRPKAIVVELNIGCVQ